MTKNESAPRSAYRSNLIKIPNKYSIDPKQALIPPHRINADRQARMTKENRELQLNWIL